MILSELIINNRINDYCEQTGLDQLDVCLDRQHYIQYKHDIEYCYNSRGFRDKEWPVTTQELQDSVWCIGDSFTVGTGSPLSHTWPQVLEKSIQHRCINVGMDGASNEWITRQALNIIHQIQPRNIVILWSYLHRRESTDTTLNNEDRRIWSTTAGDQENWDNFTQCQAQLINHNVNIVQGIVPNYADTNTFPLDKVIAVPQLDRARDGHHFDIVTSNWFVTQIKEQLVF